MPDHAGPAQRIVVGYIATERGRDAVALASFLATGTDTELLITLITPEHTPYGKTPRAPIARDDVVDRQVRAWLDDALDLVPEGIAKRGIIQPASSEAAGLMNVAAAAGATMIVIGARAVAMMRQVRIGTVAAKLLSAPTIPVALAPGGFAEPGPVRRVNAFHGARPGAAALVRAAVRAALERDVSLRLISLLAISGMAERDVEDLTEFVEDYAGGMLHRQAAELLRSSRAEMVTAEGADLEQAARAVAWQPGDVAFIGSSRLGRGRVFISARARRILEALPRPVIVVPRNPTTSEDADR